MPLKVSEGICSQHARKGVFGVQAEGHVSTNVLRTGFISQKDLKGATDSALVLTGSDTVANVDSQCFGSLNYSTPLATLLSSQPSTSTGVSYEAGQSKPPPSLPRKSQYA